MVYYGAAENCTAEQENELTGCHVVLLTEPNLIAVVM